VRFEGWRTRKELSAGRAAAVAFWQDHVVVKLRKDWQLARWGEAMGWYLAWLEQCVTRGLETRSVGERMGDAVRRVNRARRDHGVDCAQVDGAQPGVQPEPGASDGSLASAGAFGRSRRDPPHSHAG
jgi:hypothetical protein